VVLAGHRLGLAGEEIVLLPVQTAREGRGRDGAPALPNPLFGADRGSREDRTVGTRKISK
jgi:hypothetical protein